MGAFLKFVLALVANILWQRVGGKGAVPPVRLPRGKKPVDIPVLAPWQMMVAMWVARKVWASVGGQVKDTLASSPNTAARQVGSWLPDPPAPKQAATPPVAKSPSTAQTAQTPRTATTSTARTPHTWTAPATPATPPAPQPAPAPRPPRDYGTRRLDDTNAADTPATAYFADEDNSATSAAPPSKPSRAGSLLSSLRRGASS